MLGKRAGEAGEIQWCSAVRGAVVLSEADGHVAVGRVAAGAGAGAGVGVGCGDGGAVCAGPAAFRGTGQQ